MQRTHNYTIFLCEISFLYESKIMQSVNLIIILELPNCVFPPLDLDLKTFGIFSIADCSIAVSAHPPLRIDPAVILTVW